MWRDFRANSAWVGRGSQKRREGGVRGKRKGGRGRRKEGKRGRIGREGRREAGR